MKLIRKWKFRGIDTIFTSTSTSIDKEIMIYKQKLQLTWDHPIEFLDEETIDLEEIIIENDKPTPTNTSDSSSNEQHTEDKKVRTNTKSRRTKS